MGLLPTASAHTSAFVLDIPHSLLILRHDFIGHRWLSSVIAGCRTAPGRPRAARPVTSARRRGRSAHSTRRNRPGTPGDADPECALAASKQSARLSQAPPLVLLKPSRVIFVARIDQHHFGYVTGSPDGEPDVRVSDLVIGDVAAALREHGSATLDEALLLLPPS